MSGEITALNSKHFSAQPLADGIYATIARVGGSAICNAGIVDLGGLCLVFDTFLTPGAAEVLDQAVKELAGREPDFVTNSHYHNDHIWGNQVFKPSTHIVSSDQTLQLILTDGKLELEDMVANAAQELTRFQEQYQKAENDAQRNAAQLFLGYYRGLVEDLPRLTVRLPDITFSGKMVFRGTRHSAELIAYDQCHTGNDAVLFIPDSGILFMSDLLFVGCHPYLGDGDPANLVKTLKEIKGLKATIYVPGHGPIGNAADLDLMIAYVEDCIALAHSLVKDGRADKKTIAALPVPERYQNWEFSWFYQTNLHHLCQSLT